ncbi:MAG TPA: hypothetical protein VIG24_04220 [Acidimicrobiia bacterium]
MSEEPIPYALTDKAELLAKRLRIEELEHILRHIDRTSLDLLLYVKQIDRLPTKAEWETVRAKIEEMTDPYGPRHPYR